MERRIGRLIQVNSRGSGLEAFRIHKSDLHLRPVWEMNRGGYLMKSKKSAWLTSY
jgi:hypothetical protein